MIRSQLNSYSGADPIWGFVALIGSERYTGEAAVGIDPRVRLFAVDGRVYFAEREGDAPIGTRLVNCGAVSTTQLEAGVVQIGETSSLSRLFQRQPAIDRDAVELTIELATESLLESVANKAVGMPEVFPLRHHSSGVHHWLRATTSLTPPAPTNADFPVAAAPAAEAPVVAVPVAAAPVHIPDEHDLHFIEEVAAQEQPMIEELPVINDTVMEEAAVESLAVMEEAAAEDVVAIDEPPVIQEFSPEPVEAAWGAELLADTAPAAWRSEPELDGQVDHAPVEAVPIAAPAAVFELPTLSSFSQPAAEESDAEMTQIEKAPAEEAHEPAVDDEVSVVEPILAPMPALSSLTLPTLQTMSAPDPAGSDGDLVAALSEQPGFAPVNPYEPGEQPADLPRLASAPISMSDLAAANAAPATPFGEPAHTLAAVDIWEMVDVLTHEGRVDEQELVGSGASEKRGRGWLRGKKD